MIVVLLIKVQTFPSSGFVVVNTSTVAKLELDVGSSSGDLHHLCNIKLPVVRVMTAVQHVIGLLPFG